MNATMNYETMFFSSFRRRNTQNRSDKLESVHVLLEKKQMLQQKAYPARYTALKNIGLSDTSLESPFMSEYFFRRSQYYVKPFLSYKHLFRSTASKKNDKTGKMVIFYSVPWSDPCWPMLLIHTSFEAIRSSVAII